MRVPRLAALCAALACLVRLDAHPYHVECDDPLQLGESFMGGGETERAPETAIVRFDGFGCSAAHPVGGEYTPGEVLTVQVTGVPGCALLELTGGATFRDGMCGNRRYGMLGINGRDRLVEAVAPATWTGATIGVRAVYGTSRFQPTWITTECQLRAARAPAPALLHPPPPSPPPPARLTLFDNAPVASLSGAAGSLLVSPVVLSPVAGSTTLTLNLSLGMVRYLGPGGVGALTYGFNGGLTGPTIRVKPGDTLRVRLSNNLPAVPDAARLRRRLQGECHASSLTATSLHAHGLHTSPLSDDVFTALSPGETRVYEYVIPEQHQGGTHWYHPHLHGVTALQLGGGAAGALVVEEHAGQLPAAIAAAPELPVLMVLHLDLRRLEAVAEAMAAECRSVCAGQALCHPESWAPRVEQGMPPSGGLLLVNGQHRPSILMVAGQWHRLRLVFSSVSAVLLPSVPTCDVRLLSKDGILLPLAPRSIDGGIVPPGGRADWLIRCPAGTHALRSGPATPSLGRASPAWPGGPTAVQAELLTLVAQPDAQPPAGELPLFVARRPCYMVDLWPASGANWSSHRMALRLGPGSDGRLVNGERYVGGASPAAMRPSWAVGAVVELELAGVDAHPVHVHVHPFQLPPATHGGPAHDGAWAKYFQPGDWHDTLLAPWVAPDQIVRVRLQTDAFAGPLLLHCHNLDHSDGGQMLLVSVSGTEGATWEGAKRVDPACARAASDVGPPALVGDASRYKSDTYPRRFPSDDQRLTALEYAGGAAAASVLILLLASIVGRWAVCSVGRQASRSRVARPGPMLPGRWPRQAEAVVYSHKIEMKLSSTTSESGSSMMDCDANSTLSSIVDEPDCVTGSVHRHTRAWCGSPPVVD